MRSGTEAVNPMGSRRLVQGRWVAGAEGDFGSEHKGSRGGVTGEGKGREEEGGLMNQLSFVVQMLLETVTAHEACDWWPGLNCKVHFRRMAVAARL